MTVIVVNFRDAIAERNRISAGSAAYLRAIDLGYSKTAAQALRRTAKSGAYPGETPAATAHRIVRLPPDSATVPSTPRTPKDIA